MERNVNMTIYAGTGKASITPPVGTPLSGYMAKERVATSVHDPIHARVIAVKNGDNCFVIISLDLLCIDKVYTEQFTNRLSKRYHIPAENVFIHATHTHSGPGGNMADTAVVNKAFPYLNGWMPYDDTIVRAQHDQMMKAVEDALSSMESCEVRYGESEVHGVALNRNSPDQPHEPKLRVVEFKYTSGEKALIYHFACHPTIMHADSTDVSADFPGVTSRNLEQQDDIRLALFLNGPCGDISTRFTRRDSTFEEVERLGTLLSDGILRALDTTDDVDVSRLKSKYVWVEVQPREIEDSETLRRRLADLQQKYEEKQSQGVPLAELRQLESQIEGVATSIEIGDNIRDVAKIKTPVQLLRLGDIVFVGIPGELFAETGNEITASFSDVSLLVAGNTNDHIGYIVPKGSYEESNYESFMTLLEKGASEKFRDTVSELLAT